MFKIYQIAALCVVGVLLLMGLFLGVLSHYYQEVDEAKSSSEKLSIASKTLELAIAKKDLDFLKQSSFDMDIFILDDTNKPIYTSNKALNLSKIGFFENPIFKEIPIDDKTYFVLSQAKLIDNKTYKIALFALKDPKKYTSFWLEFFTLFAIALLGAFVLIFWVRKSTQKQFNQIIDRLYRLTKRDFKEFKENSGLIEEFKEIALFCEELSFVLEKQEKKNKKYSKKLRLKYLQSSSIIAALSHEFKNPLAVILGYCEAVLSSEISSEQKNRFLSKIHSQAQRLNQLLNRLNLAVRLENDLEKLNLTSFNFKPLIQEVISHLQMRYKDKKITLKLKDTTIKADKVLMENVITNLIENALKYSRSGIKVVLKKNHFKVSDDGMGIEPKQLELVTKKFYRLQKENQNKNQENSLGLGLFIVKYILKLHSKKLKIKSVLNKGSSFGFDFD